MASGRSKGTKDDNAGLRMAVYLRISKDPDGTSTATQRQLRDCKRYTQLKGWKIAQVFEDVDVSAYDEARRRPRYEELLDGLAAGDFDGVLVWKLDRLVRRVSEFERFWKVCSGAGAILASFNESIDTSTEIGMLIVRILVAFAQMESASTSLRLRALEAERARAGIPKRTGYRPYGISADWSELVADEAARIREAAERVLAGESVRSICLDWNAQGVPSSTGKRWVPIMLKSLLVQPRLWGQRVYAGETVTLIGVPSILDEETGQALIARLASARQDPTPRIHLLSGLLRCWKCGGEQRMGGGAYLYHADGRRIPRYVCPAPPEGCAGTTVQMESADRIVSDMVLYRLDSPELAKMLKARRGSATKDATLMNDLAAAEGRQRELDAAWARGEMSGERLASRQRELDEVIDGLRRQLALIRQVEPLERILGEPSGLRSTWNALPTSRQRAIIDVLIEKIVVHPPTTRGPTVDVNRFEPIWRV
jgi:site-specific DNA recombinase